MMTFGLETSCDETAAAVMSDLEVRSNVVLSQLEHSRYGGVVPELASRAHIRGVIPVIEQALEQAQIGLDAVDGIAVTSGPGLAGSLIVGINTAKGLALAADKPLIGVNHLEGHIFSTLIEHEIDLPFLTLLVSGGHTELLIVRQLGEYDLLGRTLDDAAGEAFDKVAKLLRLLPPDGSVMGGRAVAASAADGDETAFAFPRAIQEKDRLDFSFSGLKTAVLNQIRLLERENAGTLDGHVADLAASFQAAVVDALVSKTVQAMHTTGVHRVALAGGVAANQLLRTRLGDAVESRRGSFYSPSPQLCTDNAAMIAAAGQFHLTRGRSSGYNLDAQPRAGCGQLTARG